MNDSKPYTPTEIDTTEDRMGSIEQLDFDQHRDDRKGRIGDEVPAEDAAVDPAAPAGEGTTAPAGVGTMIAEGGLPWRYAADGSVAVASPAGAPPCR